MENEKEKRRERRERRGKIKVANSDFCLYYRGFLKIGKDNKMRNIKLTIEKDILLGEPVLLLNIEVFDVISNVILDGSDVLRIANIALEMIKALSGMERQWLDDSFTVINVVWHFPHCQD